MPQVVDLLNAEGLIEREDADAEEAPVGDLTREPLMFPAGRDVRLQNLARADEGYLLALGYSTQRGYAKSHPFVGEIRSGEVGVEIDIPELGFAVDLGDLDRKSVVYGKGVSARADLGCPRIYTNKKRHPTQHITSHNT